MNLNSKENFLVSLDSSLLSVYSTLRNGYFVNLETSGHGNSAFSLRLQSGPGACHNLNQGASASCSREKYGIPAFSGGCTPPPWVTIALSRVTVSILLILCPRIGKCNLNPTEALSSSFEIEAGGCSYKFVPLATGKKVSGILSEPFQLA